MEKLVISPITPCISSDLPVSDNKIQVIDLRRDSSIEVLQEERSWYQMILDALTWIVSLFKFWETKEEIEQVKLENFQSPTFQNIDSSQLKKLPFECKISKRKDFLKIEDGFFPPPMIGKSDFVSKEMVVHLMRNKKDEALGVKYVKGDHITNMEGVIHTFVTPVCRVVLTGDYRWAGKVMGMAFGNNLVREVILSAAIHPDFEKDSVMMALVKITEDEIVGEEMQQNEIPSAEEKKEDNVLQEYETKLKKHLIYHLTHDHQLPALSKIAPDQIMDSVGAKAFLDDLLQNPEKEVRLEKKFVKIKEGTVISLEMLYNTYCHQIRNEFKVLDSNTPQGYIYTINPPSIFAKKLEGPALLNRLQALSFRALKSENLFTHLKEIGYADYKDKEIVPLLQKSLPDVKVTSLDALYEEGYKGSEGYALVIHNNSDGFGQNVESEGPTSLDGVIGSFSSAASSLKRQKKDLVDNIL